MRIRRNQDGMALLLVLVIVALLTALLTEFSFSTLVDLRSTETFRDRTQAFYLARGGVEAAGMILKLDQNDYDHPSEFWGELPPVPVDDGDINLEIEDLTGRLYVNNFVDRNNNRQPGYHRFVQLCQDVLQISKAEAETMAESLQDWTNPNPTFVSGDDSYYAGLTPSSSRGKRKLETVDELLRVRWFDEDILRQLTKYVRVVGVEKINVNTAPAEVLHAWQFNGPVATEFLDMQNIDAIIDYRQQTPFTTRTDLNLVSGLPASWVNALPADSVQVKGEIFQVTSNGRINDVTRRVEAVIQKSGKILSIRVE